MQTLSRDIKLKEMANDASGEGTSEFKIGVHLIKYSIVYVKILMFGSMASPSVESNGNSSLVHMSKALEAISCSNVNLGE